MTQAEAVEPKAAPDRSKKRTAPPTVPLFTAPTGKADDLKKIEGVGPALERKLNALGVTRYDQIASFTDEEVGRIDDALNYKGRVTRDDWVGQAKALAAG
jgi:predicted flap endonuclease-1-like 5' DNA nuclease